MLAGIYNIVCEQGTTFTRVITLEYPDPDDPEIFLPWNFTGYTARMQIRRTIDSSTVMIELTTEDGGLEFTDLFAGQLTVHMTDEQTASLTSDGVYDIEIISDAGDVSRLVQGNFTLNREVTR
jgi:hypothetical protein